MAVMAARLERKLPLHHPQDETYRGPSSGRKKAGEAFAEAVAAFLGSGLESVPKGGSR